MIWGDISRYVNGENVLGGVAYKNNTKYHILLVIILVPSVVFVCAIVYKPLGVLGILHLIKGIVVRIWQFGKSQDDNESPEAEPHRLTHPTQYTSLLQ